jgi:hypothetical protein
MELLSSSHVFAFSLLALRFLFELSKTVGSIIMATPDDLVLSMEGIDVSSGGNNVYAINPRFHELYKDSWRRSADKQEERRRQRLERQQK